VKKSGWWPPAKARPQRSSNSAWNIGKEDS
jgi:hypothetical protein